MIDRRPTSAQSVVERRGRAPIVKGSRTRRSCAVLAVLLCAPWARGHETSDAYLRNVVDELRLMNEPPSPTRPQPVQDRRATAGTRHELQPQVVSSKPHHAEETPAVLGFTPAELAAMYTTAIERGTPLKYDAFINTLNYQMPNIVDGRYGPSEHDRPHLRDPQYAYYFYPLQSFHHELTNHHGYRTAPNFQYDSMPAKSSKKEMNAMNPILVGISSFMGMALFFLISLFFYPRFMHLVHFPFFATSRTIFQNELTHIAAFVTEAIEYYNKTVRKRSKRSSSVESMK